MNSPLIAARIPAILAPTATARASNAIVSPTATAGDDATYDYQQAFECVGQLFRPFEREASIPQFASEVFALRFGALQN